MKYRDIAPLKARFRLEYALRLVAFCFDKRTLHYSFRFLPLEVHVRAQPRSQGLLRFQDGGWESGVDPGNEVTKDLGTYFARNLVSQECTSARNARRVKLGLLPSPHMCGALHSNVQYNLHTVTRHVHGVHVGEHFGDAVRKIHRNM